MQCRKYGSEAIVKNGFMAGAQRYKCKNCSFQFTRDTPHGKTVKDKSLALVLYLSGLSMNMTGKIVGASTRTVMRWIGFFMTNTLRINHLREVLKKLTSMKWLHASVTKRQILDLESC